jgi:hypothetical protein
MSNGVYKPSSSTPVSSTADAGVYVGDPSVSSAGIWIAVGVGICVLIVALVIAVLVGYNNICLLSGCGV